jgi:Ca2+/H+ antiporter
MNNSLMLRIFFNAAILIGFSAAALGQATRTWVSGVGRTVGSFVFSSIS